MTVARKTLKFDLYFDESGEFLETSNVPDEKARAKTQRFPSQLVGFVVPRGEIVEAERIVSNCKQAARLRPEEFFKGNTLTDQQLTRFVRHLVAEFQNRPHWEPVRLVNQE